MIAPIYIPGLDEPPSEGKLRRSRWLSETIEERLLHYGFTHEEIAACLSEPEFYAQQKGRVA